MELALSEFFVFFLLTKWMLAVFGLMNGWSKQCKALFSEFWDRALGNGQDESSNKRELN